MVRTAKPPVYLNLLQIRFPVAAVLSIGHRISGVVLFLCIPFCVYLLDLSLRNESGFAKATEILASTPVRWLTVVLIWMFAHHFYAGIRFLLIDIDAGVEKSIARISAWGVFVAGVVTMLIAAWGLL